MKFLLFQIYAPLVSWGEIAVGGERHSSRHPSKSAIIGLVSAALGIKRDEEERLDELTRALGVAVQLHSGGSVLADFHTTQVPKKENKVVHFTRKAELSADESKIGTILSRREYRCDALAVVALYVKNDSFSLKRIQSALQKPAFHLYFGRKSAVPALPLAPLVVSADILKEAFDQYQVKFVSPIDKTSPEWLQKAFEQYPQKTLFYKQIHYFWEEDLQSPGISVLHSSERYDQPLSRKRWQFSSRREVMAVLPREEVVNVSQ